MYLSNIFLSFAVFTYTVSAKLHEFHYNATWADASFDGVHTRPVISFNGTAPLPAIEVDKGDRINFYLTNGLGDKNTSLHFHGILQEGTTNMDGPDMISQCPIVPGQTFLYNFTVEQVGTYWYHAHSAMQYGDGLRGAFIVHDKDTVEANYDFDEELIWTITDWYHDPSWELTEKSLTRFNPTGAEPIPSNILFQDSKNVSVPVETNKTYLVHLANTGLFVAQYLYIPGHEFTVIELDGVFIKPNGTTDVLYITVGQRMSFLITTKLTADENFPIVQVMDDEMLDVIPKELLLFDTNWLVYDDTLPKEKVATIDKDYLMDNIYEEMWARPIENLEAYETSDITIELNLEPDNLGDGVNYMLLNGKTHVTPKVPSLYTALSAGEDANNIAVYGSNTNTFIIQDGEIVDIVINNLDDGKHPFHLHGHNFQVLHKSPAYEEPVAFNYSDLSIPEFPMVRDTIALNGNGNLLIRFKATNPGVWFFHCHVDYHVSAQGLAIVLIEAPLVLQQQQPDLTQNQIDVCAAANVPIQGNAAGNSEDYLDLTGENLQPKPLPDGFTPKGYFAFFVSCLIGIYGLWTIKNYGMTELSKEQEDVMIQKLKDMLVQNGVELDPATEIDDLLDENTVLRE